MSLSPAWSPSGDWHSPPSTERQRRRGTGRTADPGRPSVAPCARPTGLWLQRLVNVTVPARQAGRLLKLWSPTAGRAASCDCDPARADPLGPVHESVRTPGVPFPIPRTASHQNQLGRDRAYRRKRGSIRISQPIFGGCSGFFVGDLMGKGLCGNSWKTRSVFQAAVGAFCASTGASASTGPVRVRQDGSHGGEPCAMSTWTAASSD